CARGEGWPYYAMDYW
nr:immunoglobulin heavy chain junction region [Mus musculus]